MNYLKAALRVKLNLTNPYEIKPQYTLLNEQNSTVRARLSASFKINYDSYLLRFAFEGEDCVEKCLGLKYGQFLWINDRGDKRPYVPVSPIDTPGMVELLVRDLRTSNKNSFTAKLLSLQPSDVVKIEGPGTQFVYEGYGKLSYGNFNPAYDTSESSSPSPTSRRFKNIGIITYASGISTTFSLIRSVAMNFDHSTGISLLWLGNKEQDFVFLDELCSFVQQAKLSMNLMLVSQEVGWVGPSGKVTVSHLEDYMPPPSEDTMIIMSALQGDLKDIKKVVKDMGYPNYLYV